MISNYWDVEIVLFGTPRGKGRPRFNRRTGHAHTDGKTASYEAALRFAGGEAMAGRAPFQGEIEIEIISYVSPAKSWPKKRILAALMDLLRPTKKPDGDNLAKMVDALNGVCWGDDSQITDWAIKKRYDETPRLEVKIRRWIPFLD